MVCEERNVISVWKKNIVLAQVMRLAGCFRHDLATDSPSTSQQTARCLVTQVEKKKHPSPDEVQEIQRVLHEEIAPTLEKLEMERENWDRDTLLTSSKRQAQ